MNVEKLRLETLKNTIYTKQLKCDLALYGFYFNGEVECYSCGLKLDSSIINDNVLDIHYKYSPNCRFLLQLDKSNVPLLSGFQLPKKEFDVCGISTEMVEAGFVSCNIRDLVVCLTCGVVIGDWEIMDIPFVEHFKFSPHCEFVKDKILQGKYPLKNCT